MNGLTRYAEGIRHLDLLATPLILDSDQQTRERVKTGLKRLNRDRSSEVEEVKEEFR